MAVSPSKDDIQSMVETPFLLQAGNYSVTSGGKPVKFWPLDPENLDAVVGEFEFTAEVLPSTRMQADFSTLVLLPLFGIFDIAIEFSEDLIELQTIDPFAVSEQYCLSLMGKPTVNQMPLIVNWPESRICFAVPIKLGETEFIGKLRLEAQIRDTKYKKRLELPIRVKQSERVDNLFIYFASHKCVHGSVDSMPKPAHCWCKLKTVDAADASALADADVKLKILRDNQANGYDKINRRVQLESNSDGFVSYHGYKRDVLGLPLDWPLLVNVEKGGYVPRGHWLKLAASDIKDNFSPVEKPEKRINIPMTGTDHADLSGKKILLDPGHGVVYDNSNRRCQEWYVAHRVAEKVVELLTAPPYNVPAGNIYWTRTAGFGLIDPHHVHTPTAPEDGDDNYEFDLSSRRIRTLRQALGLKDLSNMVLTTHGANDAAQPVDPADRTHLLDFNVGPVNLIVARINTAKASHRQRVQPGSVRWDPVSDNYFYTLESANVQPGQKPVVVDNAVRFPITTNDWFNVDDAMIRVLADRSARWSCACEIGPGPNANAAAKRPSFVDAARDAMGTSARDYMRDRILRYLDVAAPHPYPDYGIKGWGPDDRMAYINAQNCDLFLTLHENAGPVNATRLIGGEVLVSRLPAPDNAPDDQIGLGKIFMKYVDPFDRGIRSEAVTKEEKGHSKAKNQKKEVGSVGMLHSGNKKLKTYVYVESEFMDDIDPDDPSKYMYERMVQEPFITTLAEQIVPACVESLLNRQANLDDIKFHGTFPLW
jgi:N-acetylmuramoyl-L-alanine amidase